MTNSYYNHTTGEPIVSTRGRSNKIRTEFDEVEDGFDAAEAALAPKASPTFTGLVTVEGGQIKFPASANDSANANTLDDYKEGTFTPALDAPGSTFNYAANGQLGYYTKIGNLVSFNACIQLAGSGNTLNGAGVTLTGLPVASANVTNRYQAGMVLFDAISSSLYSISWRLGPNATTLPLYKVSAAGAALVTLKANDLHATSGSYLWISGQYHV